VLLDAGAGHKWSYRSKESGKVYSRSEGLAVASLEMFKAGLFSSDPTEPCQVDGAGLKKITAEVLAKGMQHSDQNPLAGIEGRTGLLVRLSEALNNQDFFGVDARPGNMLGEMKMRSALRVIGIGVLIVSRLRPWSPVNTRFFRSYCTDHNVVDCANGWILPHLATFTNTNRRCSHRRRVEMLRSPQFSTGSAVGKHRSIPQADAMAVLLYHGPNV
jgi:hypothetical protein